MARQGDKTQQQPPQEVQPLGVGTEKRILSVLLSVSHTVYVSRGCAFTHATVCKVYLVSNELPLSENNCLKFDQNLSKKKSYNRMYS